RGWRRARALARRLWKADRRGNREVGQGDPFGEHQAGVIHAIPEYSVTPRSANGSTHHYGALSGHAISAEQCPLSREPDLEPTSSNDPSETWAAPAFRSAKACSLPTIEVARKQSESPSERSRIFGIHGHLGRCS